MPNERGEKLVALNIERISYWLSEGAQYTKPVQFILGKVSFSFTLDFMAPDFLNWSTIFFSLAL